ncbi:MAG: hypothetical protein FWG66_10135 [Spirochaetes bacterium]|nr:hypothetical protein [Spirochaetota bacterium]
MTFEEKLEAQSRHALAAVEIKNHVAEIELLREKLVPLVDSALQKIDGLPEHLQADLDQDLDDNGLINTEKLRELKKTLDNF